MGILFKLIIVIVLLSSYAFSMDFIHNVNVEGIEDKRVVRKLKKSLESKFVDRSDIDTVLKDLNREGVYTKLTYDISKKDDQTILNIQIQHTQKVTRIIIQSVDINSNYFVKGLKSRAGRLLNYNYINHDIEFINNVLKIKGYGFASVKDVTMSKLGVLVFTIESPKLNQINFIGLRQVQPIVLYRELIMPYQESINESYLEIDYVTLSSLPYFSSVSNPMIEHVSSENINISYTVAERKTDRLDVGLEELEDNQGIAIFSKLKVHHTLIYSDMVMLQAQLGYLDAVNIRRYKVKYQQPWLFNKFNFKFNMEAYTVYRSEVYQKGNDDVFSTIRTGVGSSFEKEFKREYLTIGTGVKIEEVYPQENESFTSYKLRTVQLFFEKNTIKEPLNPKVGYRLSGTIDKGGEIFGLGIGGIDYFRSRLTWSHYIPVTNKLVFAHQVFAGFYKKNSSEPTFETEKFSLGGANSLRGYHELSYYGDYRLSINLEPRYQVNDNVLAVVFLDAGYISDSIRGAANKNIHIGYGAGIRFLKTVFPLRLDVAYGDDLMVHVSVSQTFL